MPTQPVPADLPIFPLTGVLLLPGMWLPLNVFEPRYRNLVEDATQGGMHIGMVQPVVPREDNRPPPVAPPENPAVYRVGCAGRIDQFTHLPDGRYTLMLHGVTRFRIAEELPLQRGYRRVRADYAPFAADLASPAELEPARLLEALGRFGRTHNMPFDTNRLGTLPGSALVNGLCMSLPFGPAEKQALLESATLPERETLLLRLMEMGVAPAAPEPGPPTLN
jgi:hypothetical protein